MTIGTSNFGDLLWPGIRSIWGDKYNEWPKGYTQIFEQEDSDKAFEKYQGVTGLGLMSVKDQSKPISYADPYLGFQTIIDPVVYALGSAVTLEMYEDDQYNFINRIPAFLADSAVKTEETVGFNVLNRAFNASFTGADGVTLCNTAHPLVDGSATYSNRPTVAADLTQTSLENAVISISQFVNDRNLPIMLKPIKLVVSTSDQIVAEKILGTQYKLDSADNTINPMMGKMPLLVSPYLTDTDAWFVMTDSSDGLKFIWRRRPTPARENESDTQNLKFLITSRFGVDFVNPRCIYGSPGV